MLLLIFLPLLTVSLAFSPHGLENYRGSAVDQSSVCLTESCVETAARLIRQTDRTKNPCQDFYQFACGGFVADTVLPEHKTYVDSLSLLRDKLNMKLKALFESESEKSEPKIYKDVRRLYKTCMDTETIERESLREVKELMKRLGGWPVLEGEDWKEREFKWWELEIKAHKEGLSIGNIININIRINYTDSEMKIMEFDQFSPGLSQEYLIKGIDDDDVKAYYNYMVNIAVLLGAERERAKEEMKEALQFELKLVDFSLPSEKRRNNTALYNPMALKEVQELYPEFPMVSSINAVLDYEPSNVDPNEIVNVAVPAYISQVRELLASVPARVQANYIMWRYVQSLVSYMNDEAQDIYLEYQRVLRGKSSKTPRWEKCVSSAKVLHHAVGAMYAEKYFDLNDKKVADEMVVNIRATFRTMLENIDWMDDKTKAKALNKADKITAHMAYPKEILNDELLTELYEGLELKDDSFMENDLRLSKYFNIKRAKEFREPIIKNDWRTLSGATRVNAFYLPTMNYIHFPAGILGGVFFRADRPHYMNYGSLGMVVGHEITHGFDDEGSQMDGDGNLVNWWEDDARSEYLERAQCIIDQYDNYTVQVGEEQLNVNGVNTQGENIADNGGIKEALLSYLSLVSRLGPEPTLPGLPFTPRQLFWLSGASPFCSVSRPQSLKVQILTDYHSPDRFRVNGAFSNQPEFSEDWNCPLGSPMNPLKKCSVW